MATVIKLTNELIGKEDINWGSSASTFARETYTGGSINVTYIDAEIIPSTTLGGYIGDNLHVQNTDTGTTSDTFNINSDGDGITLSTTGLTATRTFTFPDVSQQVIGATDLASTVVNKGASLVGIYDSGGYFSGANAESVLQEIGEDVSTLQSSTHNSGMKNGFTLGYSSTTAITISGGIWAHNGTTNQHVYLSSQITFTLGPAGSNSESSNLGTDEIHYVYIDDTAVVASASRLLTATEFVNSTTAPSWSQSKVGWYNGNDRCIGAVLTNGSSQIMQFNVLSGNFYRYTTFTLEYDSTAATTTPTSMDISSTVPSFSTRARIYLITGTPDTSYNFALAATGDREVHQPTKYDTIDIPLTSAQATYMMGSAAAATSVYTVGYYTDRL